MTHLAQPDLPDSDYFRQRRPGLLRRTAHRYQVLELALIVGGSRTWTDALPADTHVEIHQRTRP